MAAVFGLSLGIAQQLRGAHFMSHTLWTAWFCLAVGWLLDASVTALKSGKPVKSR
jgi:membrane-associated PAP2 superfamily phosphatase